jgi:uncharacterized protein (TIGR02301 family)
MTTHHHRVLRPTPYAALLATALAVTVAGLPGATAAAQPAAPPAATVPRDPDQRDVKPYDDKLLRLAEIMGAVHFLRELCGAGDGQLWRERMEELIRAEGPSALRQARLTRTFNQGYRNFQRTYASCTPTAQTTITKFLAEGTQISDTLLKSIQ